MTMDERIEAAAPAIAAAQQVPEVWQAWLPEASAALAAAFPELSGDKRTHWLAPMGATESMRAAVVNLPPVGGRALWAAMRDAYLGKGDGG